MVYRPPQSPLSYLEKLCSSMLCAVNCCVLMFICGDFDLPNIDWATASPSLCTTDASTFCDIVSDCFLTQLVTFTTCKDHILDLVLAIYSDFISSISPCDNLPDTDHVASVSPQPLNHTRFLYNYHGFYSAHLSSVLIQPTFLLCCPVPLGLSLTTLVTFNCLGLCGKIFFFPLLALLFLKLIHGHPGKSNTGSVHQLST